MKKLLFICGPSGVGKSTTCRILNEKIQYSAWVDSDWCRSIKPFVFSEELINVNRRNISALLANYLSCDYIKYVIFTYGFHGVRKQIFETVMNDISTYDFEFLPFVLTCDAEKNRNRMINDKRNNSQIEYCMENSRDVYEGIDYPVIDTTYITAEQAAGRVLELIDYCE